MAPTTLHHLTTLVNRAIAAYPGEEARIRRGADIVTDGSIQASSLVQGGWRVQSRSGTEGYEIYARTCTCPDSVLGHAPGGRCKHLWGLTFSRRLPLEECMAEIAQPQPLVEHYATHCPTGAQGIAALCEDGTIQFQAFDSSAWVTCSLLDVALGGNKALIDAAWAAHA